MGGHVIEGRDDDVLEACKIYRQDIWWLVVYVKDSKIDYEYFLSSSSEQLPRLLKFVRELNSKDIPLLIFAIWHGKRRTDAFLVRVEKLLEAFR